MGHHDGVLTECHEFRQHLVDGGRIQHHVVVDAGQMLDLKGNGHLGVDEGAELLRDDAAHHLHGADLDDLVFQIGKTGRLDIEHHIGVVQLLAFGVLHDLF